MLDKIQAGSFNEKQLEAFIASTESQMLADLNQSQTEDTMHDTIELGESVKFDEGDLYKTVKFDNFSTKQTTRRVSKEDIGQAMFKKQISDSGGFDEMTSREKKEWLLRKIMELNISASVQNQLVDRIEALIKKEDDKRKELKGQLEVLENKIKRLKQNKSQNQLDEGKILEQLDSKEKQLIGLESEFKSVKDRLLLIEKEKSKMEENFVGEILGLQTGLDQKLLQIQALDKRNQELASAKEDLEEMVEEYKKYSESCKQRTREVEKEREEQVKELKKEIDWLKSKNDKKREAMLEKVEVEKLALEQTIKELMFKNKVD